jgi:signal transduction histidine kinase
MIPESDQGVPTEAGVSGSSAGRDPASMSAFLASLAHDLRSPLGIVSEAIHELRTDFSTGMTDDHRLLVGLADRGLRRIGRIADTLNLVAALDSGNFELHRQPVELVGLARSAIATAATLEPRSDVELVSELPTTPSPIMADQPRLAHAIVEIVINAIRHARRRVRVHLEVVEGRVRLAIEDDGQGVMEAARATLFRRFVGSESRAGLGIGLSIAYDVIAGHGGTVTLEASTLPPGRPNTVGARFVVSI